MLKVSKTAAGRQQNRRVEMVVTGEPIGVEPPRAVESSKLTALSLARESAPPEK
jgi:hypothetical protein